MSDHSYFMDGKGAENMRDESIRLDLKTNPETIKKQAIWAGLKPGMRVADMGCGPGKTTFHLNQLVQPGGSVLGLDISQERIRYAESNYKESGVEYRLGDIREPLKYLGLFDFVWVRFVLEFYGSTSFDIVKNLSSLLKPGGILCLIDLDYNCLTHYGISEKLEKGIRGIMQTLQEVSDFDAYAGRKLYSYLYDLGYREVEIDVSVHHLIYGQINKIDAYNWGKKLEIAAKSSGYNFDEFAGGFEGFHEECSQFFEEERRFSYTPIIACRGRKP